MTIDDLITLSMREIQAIADGETPTPTEFDLALKRFNTLVSSLSNDLVVICCRDTGSIDLVAGQASYPTEADTFRVVHFDDRQINVLSTKDYDQYYQPSVQGRVDVYVDYTTNPPTIEYMTPPTEVREVTYRRDVLAQDLVLGEEIKYTNNAREFLILGLAYKLCPAYGVDPQTRASVEQDYLLELRKYKQAQTVRVGDEIVTPNITIV